MRVRPSLDGEDVVTKTVVVPVINADFSQGFRPWQNIGELVVASGWVPWWRQGAPDQVYKGYFKRPEYKPETKRTDAGETGQKYFTTFATHEAGIMQRVAVPPGVVKLELFAHVQYWSEHTDGSGGGYALHVGIDLAGGTDGLSDAVTWGDWVGQDDDPKWDGKTWRLASVEVELAPGPERQVTVFLGSLVRHRVKWNDAYWRRVQLTAEVREEGPGPGPGPLPGGSVEELVTRALLAAEAVCADLELIDAKLRAVDALLEGDEL